MGKRGLGRWWHECMMIAFPSQNHHIVKHKATDTNHEFLLPTSHSFTLLIPNMNLGDFLFIKYGMLQKWEFWLYISLTLWGTILNSCKDRIQSFFGIDFGRSHVCLLVENNQQKLPHYNKVHQKYIYPKKKSPPPPHI